MDRDDSNEYLTVLLLPGLDVMPAVSCLRSTLRLIEAIVENYLHSTCATSPDRDASYRLVSEAHFGFGTRSEWMRSSP
jgi:hypothetical protein